MKEYKTSILNYAEKVGIEISDKSIVEIIEDVKENLSEIFLNGKLTQYEINEDLRKEKLNLFTRLFKFDDNIQKLSLLSTEENYFDLIRNTHSYEGRKLLWKRYYGIICEYNKKIDYLIKEGIYVDYENIGGLKLEKIRFISVIDIVDKLDLQIIKKISSDLQKIGFVTEAKLIELLEKNYIYIEKINKHITILNLQDLLEVLALLKNNITYDKVSTNTELKQFNNNTKIIKNQVPNISKKHLSNIKFILFLRDEEFNKYLPYITEKNLYKYKNNLTYLIKNSLCDFNENNDFGIKQYDIEFSEKENNDKIEACEGFESDTYNYFSGGDQNFFIIKIDGQTIGHKKTQGAKTFLSYENIEDKNGNVILLKGGVYNFDIGILGDYMIDEGKYGKVQYTKEHKIINISKENSKKIKIKFLRLISNNNYILSLLNNSTDGKIDEAKNIWYDLELFKDEIYYKIGEEKK